MKGAWKGFVGKGEVEGGGEVFGDITYAKGVVRRHGVGFRLTDGVGCQVEVRDDVGQKVGGNVCRVVSVMDVWPRVLKT